MPEEIRQHLQDRVKSRHITNLDLQRLDLWLKSNPEVPEGDWYKDFDGFYLCGTSEIVKTFLDKDMRPYGVPVK